VEDQVQQLPTLWSYCPFTREISAISWFRLNTGWCLDGDNTDIRIPTSLEVSHIWLGIFSLVSGYRRFMTCSWTLCWGPIIWSIRAH